MPNAPGRLCKQGQCGQIVHDGAWCPEHKPKETRPNSNARGYGGKGWEATRHAIFVRDNYTCQMCGELVGLRPKDAHCDHAIPKDRGGSEAMTNLQTLCNRCHGAKTRMENAG